MWNIQTKRLLIYFTCKTFLAHYFVVLQFRFLQHPKAGRNTQQRKFLLNTLLQQWSLALAKPSRQPQTTNPSYIILSPQATRRKPRNENLIWKTTQNKWESRPAVVAERFSFYAVKLVKEVMYKASFPPLVFRPVMAECSPWEAWSQLVRKEVVLIKNNVVLIS